MFTTASTGLVLIFVIKLLMHKKLTNLAFWLKSSTSFQLSVMGVLYLCIAIEQRTEKMVF